jgi:hypothetical protein
MLSSVVPRVVGPVDIFALMTGSHAPKSVNNLHRTACFVFDSLKRPAMSHRHARPFNVDADGLQLDTASRHELAHWLRHSLDTARNPQLVPLGCSTPWDARPMNKWMRYATTTDSAFRP